MGWGDELMAAGEAQKAYAGEPVAILNSPKGAPRWHAAWQGNLKILKPGMSYRHSIVNGPGHRPYVQTWNGNRWFWKQYKPTPAELHFSAAELAAVQDLEPGFIALEPHCKEKAEAVNRDWGWQKWEALSAMLLQCNHRVVQFGVKGVQVLPGVQFWETPDPRIMAAGLGRAKAFVSTEGGFHHTAGAMNVPGVVIYGHFNSPMVTGYDMHRSIFSGGLGCGSRVKCKECRQFLDALSADQVFRELNKIL